MTVNHWCPDSPTTLECGCRIEVRWQLESTPPQPWCIELRDCPLHRHAGELLAALKRLQVVGSASIGVLQRHEVTPRGLKHAVAEAEVAIQAAEPQEVTP